MKIAPTYSLSRCKDPDEFYRLFRHLQPGATMAIGTAIDGGLKKRTSRCVLVSNSAGEIVGGVITARMTILRWTTVPVLADLGAAQVVAAHIDGGPADGIHCALSLADVITPLLTRHRRTVSYLSASTPSVDFLVDPDPHCRLAGPEDHDQIVELYASSPLNFEASLRAVRSQLERARHEVVVYDAGGTSGIVGFGSVATRTPEYDVFGSFVVASDERDKGIAWAIAGFIANSAFRRGVGLIAHLADSNPMTLPADAVDDDPFVHLSLRAPRRFRGEPRLHRLWYRLVARAIEREVAQQFTHDRVGRKKLAWRADRTDEKGDQE